MANQIQIRRDTAANWTAVNPVLAQGEIGQELDTGRFKIGNGTTAWNSRIYASFGTEEWLWLACSDETSALTTGTAKITFRMPFAATLLAVRANVKTAPTGAILIVDINEEGTSLLSTKLSIDATERTSTTAATAAVISDPVLIDDAEMTIDIDQVGSTVAGVGLKVGLYVRRQ